MPALGVYALQALVALAAVRSRGCAPRPAPYMSPDRVLACLQSVQAGKKCYQHKHLPYLASAWAAAGLYFCSPSVLPTAKGPSQPPASARSGGPTSPISTLYNRNERPVPRTRMHTETKAPHSFTPTSYCMRTTPQTEPQQRACSTLLPFSHVGTAARPACLVIPQLPFTLLSPETGPRIGGRGSRYGY